MSDAKITRGLRERLHRARAHLMIAAQCALAAGLAWFVADTIIPHPNPFFAPISAVTVLGASLGQRLRRATEMMFGVALGIGVGDALIVVIGVGPVQLGAVVLLAILVAVFAGGSGVLASQAASSAVLVTTLAPPSKGIYYTRFVDALIGGGVGLLVLTVLLPFNPFTVVRRAADPALGVLVNGLTMTATALREGDQAKAQAALDCLREGEAAQKRFRELLPVGRETVTLSPAHWRSRGALAQYLAAAEYLDRLYRNSRVLCRRARAVLSVDEPRPEGMIRAVERLAEAVTVLRQTLGAGLVSDQPQKLALAAVREAAAGHAAGVGFSGTVVVAQVRSAAVDLLRAGGVEYGEAERIVRRTAARRPPTHAAD